MHVNGSGRICAVLLATVSGGSASLDAQTTTLQPVAITAAVANDADDPAIWTSADHPERSLIIGTNKLAAPDGALVVFGVDGTVRQTIPSLDRPNNVDIEYGLSTPAGPIDIAVVTERLRNRLRVYQISESGLVAIDGGGIPVLDGMTGEAAMPMGIGLYKRNRDQAVFAIVAPKTGGSTNYLWQYRLTYDADARAVRGTLVRRFGSYSGTGEIEAVAVDDGLGYVYYADEEYAIRKWAADPDARDAGIELAAFGREGFTLQREGIALIAEPDGTGYIVCTDQIPGGSRLHIYRREGQPGRPHDHDPVVAVVTTAADSTDGIEITRTGLPGFPRGLLAMMNSSGRNFQFYDLSELLTRLAPPVNAAR